MDGVTPYGTMNTTGVKGSAQVLGVPGIYKKSRQSIFDDNRLGLEY